MNKSTNSWVRFLHVEKNIYQSIYLLLYGPPTEIIGDLYANGLLIFIGHELDAFLYPLYI